MTVYRIKDGAVQVDFMERGDMTVAVVGSDEARAAIQACCRGHGRWNPDFKNWIVFQQNSEEVLAEIMKFFTPNQQENPMLSSQYNESENRIQFSGPYRELAESFIEQARKRLETGEGVDPHVAFMKRGSGDVNIFAVNIETPAAKQRSAELIRGIAKNMEADCAIFVSEAWGLNAIDIKKAEEIYKKYGSIGNYPDRVETVCFAVETLEGFWMGMATTQLKYPSKKKRTFGQVQFIQPDKAVGNFVSFLPQALGRKH